MDENFDTIVDYCISRLNAGVSEQALRQEFIDKQYPQNYIDAVFEEIHPTSALPPAEVEDRGQTKPYLTDLFVHTLSHTPMFSGRIDGRGYLLGLIYSYVLNLGFFAVILVLFSLSLLVVNQIPFLPSLILIVAGIVGFALVLANILITTGLAVRRVHDTGKSGFWAFLTFLPFVGLPYSILLVILPPQTESNPYGEQMLSRNFKDILGLRKPKESVLHDENENGLVKAARE